MVAAIALAIVSCTRQEAARSGAAAPPTVSGQKAKPVAYHAALKVSVAPQGDAPGEVVASIKTRDGFHINAEYPMSFQPAGGDGGVSFEKTRYELKENVEMTACAGAAAESCELKAKIPFRVVGTGVGAQKVAGVLAFSVCNPEQCLIEKVELAAGLGGGF
jgi:hypothetical protein